MNEVYAVNLYEKLENKLGFDLGVNQINIRDVWYDSCYLPRTRNVSLSSCLSNRQEFKEHLYHEIGHSLYSLNLLKRSCFEIFTSGACIGYSKKEAQKMDSENEPAPAGFISCYAMMSREEDWCETFSAFICNGGRTSGKIEFSDHTFRIEEDRLIKKKFKAVKTILAFYRILS